MNPLRATGLFAAITLLAVASGASPGDRDDHGVVRFQDDFSTDLTAWIVEGTHAIRIRDSGDPSHGNVLELEPDGVVYALVPESDQWGPIRVEGSMAFPDPGHSYLGFLYNVTQRGPRVDFGSVYVKGNGSYLRVNPFRDGNVSRLLYEEYKTPLTGDDEIEIGSWIPFAIEIDGAVCHIYIGESDTPKLTFSALELTSGLVGFNPRVVGARAWVDDVRIVSIPRLTYDGPPIPDVDYRPDELLTRWDVIGPLPGPSPKVERSSDPSATDITASDATHIWRSFDTDSRGAVVTGRVTEFAGHRPVAYFRTVVSSEAAREAVLHVSSTDELALWVNGWFNGYIYRDGYVSRDNDWNAWHDFWRNPEHAGRRVPINLEAGDNQIVVRARNGQFASGGFFARLESAED